MASATHRSLLFRLLVSGLMLAFAFYFINPVRLFAVLQTVSGTVLACVCLGYLGSQALTSLKWWILARSARIDTTLMRAIRAGFVGSYLNCFGLGTIGGDVGRAMLLTNAAHQRAASLASVAADRLLGMGVLASIGVLSLVLFRVDNVQPVLLTVSLTVCLLVAALWWVAPAAVRAVEKRCLWAEKHIRGAIEAFPRQPGTICGAALVSLVFHLCQIGLFALITHDLGAHIPWTHLLVAIPFANLAGNLPLSWMGVGIRENAYVLFFVPAYLSREQAVASGGIWLLAMALASALGAALAVMGGSLLELKHAAVEQNPPSKGNQ